MIRYLNLGTMLFLGACIQLLAQAFRCWDPPFSVFCIGFTLSALGTGYQDSHANSFVSTIKGSHRWLGLIHALYSLGMTVSPFVANSIAIRGAPSHSEWSRFYLFPLGLNALNVGLVAYAFQGHLWTRGTPRTSDDELSVSRVGGSQPTAGTTRLMQTLQDFWQPMTRRGVWQLSLWFFFYLGAGVTQVCEYDHSVPQLNNIDVNTSMACRVSRHGQARRSCKNGIRACRQFWSGIHRTSGDARSLSTAWRKEGCRGIARYLDRSSSHLLDRTESDSRHRSCLRERILYGATFRHGKSIPPRLDVSSSTC